MKWRGWNRKHTAEMRLQIHKDLTCFSSLHLNINTKALTPAWKKSPLKRRCRKVHWKKSSTYSPYGRKWRKTKKPLDESKRGEWKSGLKFNIQKTKIMESTSGAPRTGQDTLRETWGFRDENSISQASQQPTGSPSRTRSPHSPPGPRRDLSLL